MATNNQQLHTFSKGMVADISDAQLSNDQYRLAKNLRYITNQEENTGELHIIEGARLALQFDKNIIASTQIRQYGVLIVGSLDNWSIYRFENPYWDSNIGNKEFKPIDKFVRVFGPCASPLGDNKLSLVTRWESDDNVKLYIADGKNPLMSMNIAGEFRDSEEELQEGDKEFKKIHTDIEFLTSYSAIVFKKPIFCGLISGRLKAGLVEYSYQFYTKYGHQSEISPSTRLIPIHAGNYNIVDADSIEGYEVGATSDKGVHIRINLPDRDIREVQGYTHVNVYRITYVENGQLPTIELFLQQKLPDTGNTIEIKDVGQKALQLLSVEEYNSMTGIHTIPKVIESKNDYLFASNIEDKGGNMENKLKGLNFRSYSMYNPFNPQIDVTAEQYADINYDYAPTDSIPAFDNEGYYGGSGPIVSWRFIRATVTGDYNSDNGRIVIKDDKLFNNQIKVNYIKREGITDESVIVDASEYFDTDIRNSSYANPSVSYFLKSLRRDEIYRYGIILYDDEGNISPVQWIADIRVPKSSVNGFETFSKHPVIITRSSTEGYYELLMHPLGIQFTVNNLPEGIVAYEIVRCPRTISDIATISQGVLSRPIKRVSSADFTYPYTPSGFLTTDRFWTGAYLTGINFTIGNTYPDDEEQYFGFGAANFEINVQTKKGTTKNISKDNNSIFQFVSPEVCYTSDTFQSMVDKQDLTLHSTYYLSPITYNRWDKQFGNIYTSEVDKVMYSMAIVNDSLGWLNVGNKYIHIPVATNPYKNDQSTVFMLNNFSTLAFYTETDFTERPAHGNDTFKNFKDIADRYAYIKLYNGQPTSDINNVIGKSTIDQMAPANQYKWNEFVEQTVNDGSTVYHSIYKDRPVSIGGDNYVNWVIGGLYGLRDSGTFVGVGQDNFPEGYMNVANDTYDNKNNHNLLDDGDSIMGSVIGPGGKCYVLSVNSEDAFPMNPTTNNLGTYLCNIRQSVVPYGGTDEKSIELSNYTSYGDYFSSNKHTVAVFDGDCFIEPFEYVSQHKAYWGLMPNMRNACIVYSIPVETNINLAYTYGYEFSKNKNRSNGDITNIQVEPANVFNKFTQYKDLYAYNSAYSINNNLQQHAAQTTENAEDYEYDYRTIFSERKDNNELVDRWLKFMPANYLDVDTRYGAITGLRRFNNHLVFWQEEKTGLFSVEERTTITDDSNMPLILGTGGILSRYDYISTSNGMHADQFVDCQSDNTLYWWDYNKHELCAYAGGVDNVVVLSKIKQIQNIFNKCFEDNTLNNKPFIAFDKRYNEMIGSICDDDSVVYSEHVQAFTSKYDIDPQSAVQFADRLYFVKDNSVYEWNMPNNGYVYGFDNTPLLPYLKYVSNDNSLYTKVFDNAEFGGRVYGGEKDGLSHLLLKFSTPLKQKGMLAGSFIENREYNFRYVVPRAINENGYEAAYGDRLRGKTMQCELQSNSNSYDFSLQFIIDKYRISWS